MKLYLICLLLVFVSEIVVANSLPVDLPAAVAGKKVAIAAKAAGGLGADNLLCTISNKSTETIQVQIPSGLHFKSSEPIYQDLVTAEEMLLAIKPGASTNFTIEGFCMKAGNMSPGNEGAYTFNGYATGNLKKLAQMLGKAEPVARGYGQMFVWAITDNRPMYPLTVPKEYVGRAGEIAKFVSTVTGTPPVTVTASTAKTFTPTVEVFSKSTYFYFHNPADQTAHFKMYDDQGKELHTFYANRKLRHGVQQYEFGVNHMIPFGASPAFYLRVTNSAGKILAEEKISKTSSLAAREPELVTFVFDCTLNQAVKNATLRVYLENGTLVEEMAKYPYLPIGNFKITTKLNHLFPKDTAFIAKMEGPGGKVYYTQAVNKE